MIEALVSNAVVSWCTSRTMDDDDLAALLLVACAFALLVAWWVSQ